MYLAEISPSCGQQPRQPRITRGQAHEEGGCRRRRRRQKRPGITYTYNGTYLGSSVVSIHHAEKTFDLLQVLSLTNPIPSVQDLVVDDGNEGGAKENGKENGTSASASAKEEKKANGNGNNGDPMSPSSQRSTPASGASGANSKSGKEDKPATSPASSAKMSPPVSKALAGLGKQRKKEILQTCTHNIDFLYAPSQVTPSPTASLPRVSSTASGLPFPERSTQRGRCRRDSSEENRETFLKEFSHSVSFK